MQSTKDIAPRTRRSAPREWFTPDSYLTDGRALYRVVSQVINAGGYGFAALEDCLSLDVRTYLPAELAEMGLAPVTTAAP